MKIKLAVTELKSKMNRALGVISSKPAFPALAYAKIQVDDGGRARISGTDIGMSMIQSVEIKLVADGSGSMLVPARVLESFLAPLSSDAEIELQGDGKLVHAKSGKSKAKLPVVELSDFPVIEEMPPTQFSINAAALKTLIARTEYAAPSKGGRSAVPIVLLESTATNLKAVATDGYRVAVANQEGAGAGEFTVKLPKLLLPLLKELPGDVFSFSQSETNYFFQGGKETVLIRKTTCEFPPYQRAYGQKYKTSFNIAVPTLQTLIAIVQPFMDKDNQAFNLTVADGKLELFASSLIGEGDTSEEVVLDATLNAPSKLRMNPKFVLEYLSLVEGKVKFELSSDRTLAKFTNDKGDYEYFIMPMQDKAPAAEAPKA